MKKFEGILICTDLDGTLLRDDKSISKENLEAIEYFKAEGGYFTFVTGRLPYFVQNIYNTVNPNVPFGCSNGGAIYDHREKKYIYSKELSKEAENKAENKEVKADEEKVEKPKKTASTKSKTTSSTTRKTTKTADGEKRPAARKPATKKSAQKPAEEKIDIDKSAESDKIDVTENKD